MLERTLSLHKVHLNLRIRGIVYPFRILRAPSVCFHHSLYHLPMSFGQDELFPLVFLVDIFQLVEVKLNYIKSAALLFKPTLTA